MIGQRIGNYVVTRQIGAGGMGAVYEAVHDSIGQRVAVKVLHPAFSTQPGIVSRFFNEARAVNIVQHAGLVRSFDYGQLPDGSAYMTMELLSGESLRSRLSRMMRLPLAEALRLCRQVASALVAAHQAGIVHRDLKPDNIFIVPDPETPGGERAKVLDFGVAKVRSEALSGSSEGPSPTASGALLGTPLYMAPEQCRGAGQVDGKADVYALGVILYQALAGRPPFEAEGTGGLMVMHLTAEPPPLGTRAQVPPAVAALVHRLLEKDPARRPSMEEAARALAQLGGESAAPVVPTSPTVPSHAAGQALGTASNASGRSGRAALLGGGAVLLVVVILGAGLTAWRAGQGQGEGPPQTPRGAAPDLAVPPVPPDLSAPPPPPQRAPALPVNPRPVRPTKPGKAAKPAKATQQNERTYVPRAMD